MQALKKLPVRKIPLNHKGTVEEVTNINLMKITHVQSSDISKLLPCGTIPNIFPSCFSQAGHSNLSWVYSKPRGDFHLIQTTRNASVYAREYV